MKIHRFYTEIPLKDKREVEVKDHELINQWKNVLRFEEEDKIILFDNSGSDFLFFIKEITDKIVHLVLLEEKKVDFKTQYDLHLIPALIKKDMFELVLEKVTELGVQKIIPLVAERSIKNKLNLERSKNIIKEAVEQSGKTQIPEIVEPEKLEAVIKNREADRFYLALDPKGEKFSKKILTNKKVAIFIGPEGGFTEKELSIFKASNIAIVSLGEQILRAETAAITITSILQIGE